MRALKSFFFKLDMIGQEYNFELNQNKRHQTMQGAVLTLIIAIISIVVGFMFGKEIYLRDNPISSTSSEYLPVSKVYLKNYPILLQFYQNSRILDNVLDYFDLSVSVFTLDNDINIIYDNSHSLVDCKDKYNDFNENKVFAQNLIDKFPYLCVDFDDDTYFQNSGGTQNSTSLKYSISFCDINDETRNCKATKEFKESNPVVVIVFEDQYTDSFDYKNPVKEFVSSVSYSISYGFYKTLKLNFQNSLFISNNGWLLDDFTYYERVKYKSTSVDTNIGKSPNKVMNISFESPNIREKTTRSYLKVQELFAKIGGIINVLYILIYILSYHYIRFKYLIWVRESSIELLLNDHSLKNNNRNINNNSSNMILDNQSKLIPNNNNEDNPSSNNVIKYLNCNNNNNNKYNSDSSNNHIINEVVEKEMGIKIPVQNKNENFNNSEDVVKFRFKNNQDKSYNNILTSNNIKGLSPGHKNNSYNRIGIKDINNDIVNFNNSKSVMKVSDKQNSLNAHQNLKMIYEDYSKTNLDHKSYIISKIYNDFISLSKNKESELFSNGDLLIIKSYWKYLIYCFSFIFCCCDIKKINKLFETELRKIYSFLSIANFNYYLINEYNDKLLKKAI